MIGDIIKTLIVDPLQGKGFDAFVAVVLILGILAILFYFFYKLIVLFVNKWPELYEKIIYSKLNLRKEVKRETDKFVNGQLDSLLDNEVFMIRINEIIDEKIKSSIFDTTKDFYDRIGKIREDSARNLVSKKEVNEISKEIQETRRELAKLKGKLDIE